MEKNDGCDVSDEFWAKVEPLIPAPKGPAVDIHRRAAAKAGKALDARKTLSAVLHVLRSNVSWRALPESIKEVPTLYRHFTHWREQGFFLRLRRAGLGDCEELKGLAWDRVEGAGSISNMEAKSSRLALPSSGPEVRERELSLSEPRLQAQLLRLHGVTDASGFWNAIQGLFRECIPSNSMIAYLDYIDHPKTWMAAKVLATSNANMPKEWFEERWKLDITPPFVQSHPGIKFFRFSDIISDTREFRNTDYFRRYFKPFGWYYIACLSYWRGSRISSAIAIRRTQEQGDYRPAEIELLKKLHTHIDVVLKRLLPAHKEHAKAHWLGEFAQHLPMPLLLLDWNLDPFYVNREALKQCAVWNFGPEMARAYDPRAVFRIPPTVIQACAELKARWIGENMPAAGTAHPRVSSRLTNPDLPGYSATIALQTDSKDLIAKPGFVIYFNGRAAEGRPAHELGSKTALWRLTATERDLVRLASEGHSNHEIAVQLHKSVNTVKHQLTSAYNKLGITGRGNRLANSIGSELLAAV